MGYFNRLPDIYVAEGITSLENFKYRLVKNIFRRVFSRDDLDKYTTIFENYSIRDGDTPSSLADLVCGDVYKDWVILVINNITDVYDQWPKNNEDLFSYVESKYDNGDSIHHWETNEVLYNDTVFLKEGIEVNETFRAVLPDGTTLTKEQSVYPVSNYEYEQYQNELKRQILLPNAQIVDLIVEEFEDLVEYQPNRELDGNNNKKTNLSISQLFLNRKGSIYNSSSRNADIGAVTSFDYGSTVANATATAGIAQDLSVVTTVNDTTSTSSSNSSSSSSSSSGSSSTGY